MISPTETDSGDWWRSRNGHLSTEWPHNNFQNSLYSFLSSTKTTSWSTAVSQWYAYSSRWEN